MSNMSYCRFENTLSDLNDCIDQIEMLAARAHRGKARIADHFLAAHQLA